MAHLVIVESPAKCKTLSKYLGKDYTVLASFGHIRDLPAKDGSVRPEEDFAMTYVVEADSKRHVDAIVREAKTADSLILATDPDREGEAISWHVLEALREKKAIKANTPVQRVVFNEITKRAVLEGIANPRELDMHLVNAQQARRALDYLVGFNLSPVLWRKLPGSRSAGRVQSVALRLICKREGEIEAFRSQEYWSIHGSFLTDSKQKFQAKLSVVEGEKLEKLSIGDGTRAAGLVDRLRTLSYRVTSVEAKEVRRHPQPPFITSTLQQEAARKLGFAAKRTMQVAQKLYEGIDIGGETTGLITYMRTDGVTVAQEALAQTRTLIGKQFGDAYLPEKPRFYASKVKNAQEAHEAIRPTDLTRTPESLKGKLDTDQARLYELIWKRMVASQMNSMVLDQTSVDLTSEDKSAIFHATGSVMKFDGFKRLYLEGRDDEEDEEDRKLPKLTQGDTPACEDVTADRHVTEPPPRYSEASLVKKLEELGIGRPSTYASILSVLQDRGYVNLEKKRFTPEERGRLVTAFLENFFPRYVEYDFTANLEGELDNISAGKTEWKKLLTDFWGAFHARTNEVKEYKGSDILEKLSAALDAHFFPETSDGSDPHRCPSCADGKLSLKLGKFGAFLACSGYPECRYTRQLGESGDASSAAQDGDAGEYPKTIGQDADGKDILLKKGPYGIYLERAGEGKAKPARVSIPKDVELEGLTLQGALSLLSLPRTLGAHPETGKDVVAGLGRYGPYLLYDGAYTQLGSTAEALDIGLDAAIAKIAAKPARGGRGATVAPLRVLGTHPEAGGDIAVYSGRYGPYVKHGAVNATIPKTSSPESITLEEAVELIAARASAAPSPKAKAKAKPREKK
jgi:DNA topoisomerase-1